MGTMYPEDIQSSSLDKGRNDCFDEFGETALNNNTKPIYKPQKGWFCPAYWDDILCWPPTPANTEATIKCPKYIIGFDKFLNNATRKCTENGTWFINEELHKYWTNYTECFGSDETIVLMKLPEAKYNNTLLAGYVPYLKIISTAGYAISFSTLLVAFAVLFSIKRLHCARNTLHMNLFASFIFRALLSLLKDILFVKGVGLSSAVRYQNGETVFFENKESNNWHCKLFTSLWEFFIIANYSWILMEGLYLHNLIFMTLFAETNSNITHYILLGWGLPVLIIIPWILTRIFIEDTFCWTTHEELKMTFLVIRIPITLSVLINTVLFIRITKVLFSKLRSFQSEAAKRYQKWAKSTLVLVPLFGIHYAVFMGMSYSIGKHEIVEMIWLTCDLLFASFQGFFVAILYCFLNGEVKAELKPYIQTVMSFLCSCRDDDFRTVKSRSSVCTMLSSSSLYNASNHRHRSRCYCLHPPRQFYLTEKNKEQHTRSTPVHSWHDLSPRKHRPSHQYSPILNIKYQKQETLFTRDSIVAEDAKHCPNCQNEQERCKSEPQLGIEMTSIQHKEY